MLRTNTALWRIAFLSGFGIVPSACGGRTDAPGPVDKGSPIGEASKTTAPTDTPTSPSVSTSSDPVSRPLQPATGTVCSDSTPYLLPYTADSIPTGLERCGDGRLHRPSAVECPSKLGPIGASDAGVTDAGEAPSGAAAGDKCGSDGDCTERPLGHCEDHFYGGLNSGGKFCEYGCQLDADCGPGFLCQCGERIGACVRANCQTDSDCGSGLLCSRGTRSLNYGCSGTVYEFFCEQPDDACRVDGDCAPTASGSHCLATNDARACALEPANTGSCGRPFLVAGSARLADVQRSSDWLGAGARPDCARLSTAERAELARCWAQVGLMEHASVAAFARFTLQLLSVGAPAALVEQSQQALADELLHARLCFGLASAYAGEPIGPGPLPTEHALDLSSLEDIAALALHEGCVGETIAALEASEALALARDGAVRATLMRIEADERRHAELAWRFVSWAIHSGGDGVQRRSQRALAELAGVDGAVPPVAQEATPFDTSSHGILSAQQRAELRAAALRDVVLPCALALLPVADPSTRIFAARVGSQVLDARATPG